MELEQWLEIDEYVKMQTGGKPVAMSKYMPAREQLIVRLWDTKFEMGQLTVQTVNEDAEQTAGCIPMTAHPMHLVMHPSHGIALIQALAPPKALDAVDYLREKVEWAREDAEILRDLLRREFCDESRYWEGRELPVSPVLVRFESAEGIEPEEIGASPEHIVEASWDDLPEAIGRVSGRRMPDDPRAVDEVAGIIEEISELEAPWIDHRGLLETWEVVAEQLFDDLPMDRAA